MDKIHGKTFPVIQKNHYKADYSKYEKGNVRNFENSYLSLSPVAVEKEIRKKIINRH